MKTNIKHCIININNDEFPFLFGKVATFHMDEEDHTDIVLCITKNRRVWLGLWKNDIGDCHTETFDDSLYRTILCRRAEIRVKNEDDFNIELGLHEIEDAERFIADMTSEEFLEQLKKENFFNLKIMFMNDTDLVTFNTTVTE